MAISIVILCLCGRTCVGDLSKGTENSARANVMVFISV